MTPAPDLDIVIPVYNEGANITAVLEHLCARVKTRFRVLVCYDFEEDDTLPHARAFKSDATEIALVRNPGRGGHAAIMAGFAAATAPAVLVYMADDFENAGLIDAMAAKLKDGRDIVSASRFIAGGEMTGCPWLKAVLVRTAAFTLYHLAALPCRDATNSFRMFSRRVVDTIAIETEDGFAFSLELLVKAHRLGWSVDEVPARWLERDAAQGQSRFKVMKWLPQYLRWYFYAFATTFLFRGPDSVMRKSPAGVE